MKPSRFYAGLFILTFCTLSFEIIETRLISVTTWYHLAFFVISAAMFGMTGGAVYVYLRPDRFTRANLGPQLVRYTLLFAVSTFVSLAVQVSLAPDVQFSASMVAVFVLLALAIALPFFFSGVAVALALTRSPFPIGRVYAADLIGAALGCIGVLVILNLTDAPSAIILVGALAALAAVFFAGAGGAASPTADAPRVGIVKPLLTFLLLGAIGLLNASTRHGLQPILVKGAVDDQGYLYEKWNSFSRIKALRQGVAAPVLWGPSSKLPQGLQVEQILLHIDGAAGTRMFRFRSDPAELDFLQYDVTNLAYFARNEGRCAVIGVGGGRDLMSAWRLGFRDLTGVEINPIFVDLLTRVQPFVDFAGVQRIAGMRLIVDEARSWFARTDERFDLIQMSMIDTWAATGAGAFTLTENGLYTLEGWKIFLNRLNPSGLFTVSRWHAPEEFTETGRMISLAVGTLLDMGVADCRNHLFLASSGNVASLVLAKDGFAETDLDRLHEACGRFAYEVIISPRQPVKARVLHEIMQEKSLASLQAHTAGYDLDLTPPTDSRPFFFNMLPLSKPFVAFRKQFMVNLSGGVMVGNIRATLTLLTILMVSVLLTASIIVFPLRPAIRDVGRRLAVGGTFYFALLGLGFMLVEIALLQWLSVFLGHPVYSLSVVLFSLILAAGVGSLLSDRVPFDSVGKLAGWAILLSVYVLTLPLWLPAAFEALQAQDLLPRAALCVGVIAPAGLLMGCGFPAGMRLVQAFNDKPTPWFWGINGACGVVASVVAIVLSIAFGIDVTMRAGAFCYLLLIPAALIIGRQSLETQR